MPPRVVLDTNVWISAFITPGGTCEELVYTALAKGGELVTSPSLLNELARALHRKFGLPTAGAGAVLEFVRSMCTIVTPTERLHVITRKDEDNRVLECAVAAGADLIVSGDTRDLLPLGSFRDIPILSPRTALERLK